MDVFFRVKIIEPYCKFSDKTLLPKGTAVYINAEHHCMSTRGVLKNDVTMTTNQFSGCFLEDVNLQDRFLKMAT